MWRFILAWKCFFLILFARRLPAEAVALLGPPSPEALGALPPAAREAAPALAAPALKEAAAPSEAARPAAAPAPPDTTAATATATAEATQGDGTARGAIALLALLQREGRLLDFLEEEIDGYGDAQIGAAVRDIHRGCRRALAEHLQVEPVLREAESATVRIDCGFDPSRIRLVGNVVGQPPFSGTLRHPGWRSVDVRLPEVPKSHDPTVIAPAEVELA